MADNYTQGAAQPSAALKCLDRLVGKWRHSGGVEGHTTYEWMEGGFFLLQRVDLQSSGRQIKGMEVIGHLRPFGGEPSEAVKSRYYDNEGDTFDYVYELEGDTLTIWGGEKGSPAYFKGQFSADGNAMAGEWVVPGGGYASTMTRVK
jgi:hypothetical protein